jgi:predicted lipid-binding transport protein (Tim44 family)
VWQKEDLMKSLILALSVAVLAAGLTPAGVDAKRLGGGGFSGMQRQLPPRSTPNVAPTPAPAKPAQANPTTPPTAGAPPAPAPRRSWMGPIAGLAAGLGIAALMSHFGMGAEFGNLIMMVLLGIVAFVAIRFVMSRMRGSPAQQTSPGFNGLRFAGDNAAAATGSGSGWSAAAATLPVAANAAAFARPTMLPPGFDQEAFERIAKLTFIRMQAANDTADLTDLRQFTTPEMYAAIKLDLQERPQSEQRTDVIHVEAEVIDVVEEAERQVVSVRYHGTIREEADGPVTAFDEVWHLVKPSAGGQWAIAGIQQTQ